MKSENTETNAKKTSKVYIPLILVVAIVVIAGVVWYRNYSRFISSDDAYVDGDNISVGAKIMGRIVMIKYEEGDTVTKGSILAVLDSNDLSAQKRQMLAGKNQAIAAREQASARYNYDLESMNVLKIDLEKTRDDLDRAKKQIAGSVITQEQYDHFQKAYETANAKYEAAKTQLTVSKAQITSADASVVAADAQIGVIESQLKNATLYSPINAIVSKRWLLSGDMAQPGQTILTLTNNSVYWITVYLEETRLSKLYTGQKAQFTLDTYPGVTFIGRVYYIGSNTAAQFSLIPPNNASGNFTKITQRVPVKLSIDGTENGKPLKDYKLISGMSAVVKIIKK
jgi:membrane fusion protein (multidrug efflux system)